MREALLGLNKKPEPEPIAAVAPLPRERRRVIRTVREDEPEDTGPTTLSDHAFHSALGNWRGVKRCVQETKAETKGDIKGAVKLSFTINTDGRVAESRLVDVTEATPKKLIECVVQEATKVSFPAFTANVAVVKEAKFVF